MSGTPTLIISSTHDYTLEYNDKGSGADLDGSFYRPQAPNGWYTVGGYAQANYYAPVGPSLIVQVDNDDPDNPILAAPVDYKLIWADHGSGANMDGAVWFPVPPSGYETLGFVTQHGYDKPVISQMRCIRRDFVVPAQIGNLIWWDKGSGPDDDVATYQILDGNGNPTNCYFAQDNYHSPSGQVWAPVSSPQG